MSLIGPRPERPELEKVLELESSLPQTPLDATWSEWLGSGLRSVYGIEDSDLKLSLTFIVKISALYWI